MSSDPKQPHGLPAGSSASSGYSREEEADRALGSTRFAPGSVAVLGAGFLALLLAGVISAWWGAGEKREPSSEPSQLRKALAGLLPDAATLARVRSLWTLLDTLPTPAATRAAEKALEEQGALSAALRPRLQDWLFRTLRAGNEQAVVAPGGWLFFRKDLDYVNGPPFLDPDRQSLRARSERIAPDPVAAICDFERQLAARGIRLLLVPAPVKPCVEAHRFADGAPAAGARHNASYPEFLRELRSRGVAVYDPTELLLKRQSAGGEAQYLRTDTHWLPDAMEAVAADLAREVGRLTGVSAPAGGGGYASGDETVNAHGDIVALLGLPHGQKRLEPQSVQIHPVFSPGGASLWKPSPEADVLLLGDSFSNIYSLGALGWGEGAGLAEHLSLRLGRPVDALLRNSDGAFATRQILQRELASGRDRLQGKKVVVWEFASRELASGDWRLLPLELGKRAAGSFFSPAQGAKARVTGTVARVSAVPRPGSVPYKEHIVSVHLVDVRPEGEPGAEPKQCLAFAWSMREQKHTAAARLRPGDTVSLEIVPWDDVSGALEKFQRSELDDAALLVEPAVWAESL